MVTNRFCSTTSRSASSSRSTNAAGIRPGERTDVVDRDVEATELVDDSRDEARAPRRDPGGRRSPRAPACRRPRPRRAASASVAPSLSASTTSHPAAASQRAMPATDADRGAGDEGPLPIQPEIDRHHGQRTAARSPRSATSQPLPTTMSVGRVDPREDPDHDRRDTATRGRAVTGDARGDTHRGDQGVHLRRRGRATRATKTTSHPRRKRPRRRHPPAPAQLRWPRLRWPRRPRPRSARPASSSRSGWASSPPRSSPR